MKRKTVSFKYTQYDTITELPERERSLLKAAIASREKAYAPYSNFQVGAAVLLDSGVVVLGNNQENASYPSGLCAERVAIFSAGANYPEQHVKMIAISASAKGYEVDRPAAPCGNCRQSIAEYEQRQQKPIQIILQGKNGPVYVCDSIADLLPLAFNSSFLSDS
ncbi:Cytidine deaminase [Croceitalea dokdonensis DOKDO 023]|uniref:Cytidine deaminase n=1 Tax=Croceitalea dokdonensis DOKDO 023 TaxID=1300341 RepID=A0A0P7B2P7_9FLAO|nr:cytidine deaminase [Croceitalea dokdonensis]KPM32579.1 Cytidine deaminase [Croceitalea dokdonensis DOKDO 023]